MSPVFVALLALLASTFQTRAAQQAEIAVLFVFVVLSHDRRRVVHLNVTEHPTEEWTAQQIREGSHRSAFALAKSVCGTTERFAARAWITSSCGTRRRCGGFCAAISITTRRRVRT